MKNIISTLALLLAFMLPAYSQVDKEQFALAISKADEANIEKLKAYIWKRKSDVSIDGQVKLTTITEFSFDDQGKLQAKVVDAESSVKQKPGVRGRVQQNAAEDKAEYVQKALELSMAYTFMTKGQLLDFFSKASVSEKDGKLEAIAENVYVQGDKLTIWVDKKTNLYTKKVFSSLLGKDPIDGEINFEKFSSGVNHGTTTIINMPAQKMRIDAKNQDYSQRIN
ncbi:MAG: hypothetical protein KF846_12015 [Cyclobacteriaceae bacterium]|nr:hypothetical protein [Cyclobacteriaceae bacterium]MBX2956876.1 hypothetical protein [Cyclobacteriaceae bacterium]